MFHCGLQFRVPAGGVRLQEHEGHRVKRSDLMPVCIDNTYSPGAHDLRPQRAWPSSSSSSRPDATKPVHYPSTPGELVGIGSVMAPLRLLFVCRSSTCYGSASHRSVVVQCYHAADVVVVFRNQTL